MRFNAFPFFVAFLPLTLVGYYLISKYAIRLSTGFLIFASLTFYACWNSALPPLLIASIGVNYALGKAISRHREADHRRLAKLLLMLGLILNVAVLAFFKYADVASLISPPWGISFFTLTQMAYLLDCHAGKVCGHKIENYALLVSFFPRLIAGPIVRHQDMAPQLERLGQVDGTIARRGRMVIGMSFFAIGLFKKVILADGIARFVGPVFDISHASLTMLEAWSGALAYTFQVYFDVSAYSDMAYGLAYLFGIVLPINFDSPYKARSIIDFWRRWQITLSDFVRDYLYIPLGGNRRGAFFQPINLLLVMVLGGLWHGANWTFLAWGALHGFYLIVNHGARRVFGERAGKLSGALGLPLTFFSLVLGWVFFRASSIKVACNVLAGMWSGTFAGAAGSLGINRIMAVDVCLLWLAGSACMVFLMPNAYQLIGKGVLAKQEALLGTARGGLALGLLLGLIMLLLTISETCGVAEFIYFKF